MNTAFHENKAELGILILTELLKMLANSDSLLDQMVQVFWDFRSHAFNLQEAKDFLASHTLHLSNAIRVTEEHSNLRGSQTSPGKLLDLVDHVLGRGLQPRGGRPLVREGSARDTLSVVCVCER
eukprot:TRINITY_DN120_c0_g1_i3.p1 TRINITY_DN120_c0_g1~~TRINITY_DN120_c0_g1_i3.p1  ORF type:complete len:124 (+),score=13.94 TRINITY_DN120_c0_g1_i3:147-518(+)